MPFDLKSVKKALGDFATFSKNLAKLFQETPKTIQKFATDIKK